MQRFLQQVASYFFHKAEKTPACLIFPNKRSAIYFRQYFRELSIRHPDTLAIMPDTTTIGQFLEQQSGFEAINGVEALFEMYEVYREVADRHGAKAMEFDRFVFWGRMLISDFNDIDASLANADALYKNLKNLKEISSNFLTEEQLEVLKYVFGENMVEYYRASDNGRFWRHIDEEGSKARSRFVEMWQMLYDIYKEYTRRITEAGLAYPGLMARTVCKSLRDGSFVTNYAKIAFVGFNAPSVALMSIMKLLHLRDSALFFWDKLPDNSPINERAGRRVAKLAGQFAMPDDYEEPQINLPKIDVMAVPSKTLQTKQASAILRDLQKEKLLNTQEHDNTAVILPDPSLLTPLVQSLPNDLGELNITMGLPMRNTYFASLMRNIITLQANVEIRNGILMYRSQDVRVIVSNPRLLTSANAACCAIKNYLDHHKTYMVSVDDLTKIVGTQDIAMLFEPGRDNTAEASHEFLCNVLNLLKDTASTTRQNKLDRIIIQSWQNSVDNVFELLKRHNIVEYNRNAYFSLVWRTLATDDMHLSGSPLKGLQIMGMLETRALDFDNIIVLSVNNNVCPPRNSHRTFIPAMLRRAFGLPVKEDYALEFDYYFLRMLSRAQRVTFLYDSRTSYRRNARSHLIDQLVFMKPKELKMTITPVVPEVDVPDKRRFAVEKTDDVMARVNKLTQWGSGVSLSATALKAYRKCPLKFYLTTICRLREEDEPEEYMTASEYGTIVHRVLENIFNDMRPKGSSTPVEVTLGKLTAASNPVYIKGLVDDAIDEIYHHNFYKNHPKASMPGESKLLGEFMAEYVAKVIDKEIDTVTKNGSFTFVEAEEDYYCYDKKGKRKGLQLDLGNGRPVNFTLKIDRHDIMSDGTHRFIDYKTGNDDNKVVSIPELFNEYNSSKSSTNDAALQVLMYAEAYKSNHPGFNGRIQPTIYKLQKAFIPKLFEDDKIKCVVDKKDINLIWSEDAEWRKEFVNEFRAMIDSIFDRSKPFRQTKHLENCKYCSLLDFCMRKPKEF